MQSALFEKLALNASLPSSPRSRIPAFLYACAWKKQHRMTVDLVYKALTSGYEGFDVTAQPREACEDHAGACLRRAIAGGQVRREDLFVQTKFTPVHGQDLYNLPYDPKSSIVAQVETSIASSLHKLRHHETESTYIDCLVLESPLPTAKQTREAWQACERHVPNRVRNLGISNTSLPVLQELYGTARVKPAVVQNRFRRDTEYDVALRKFCRDKGIVYQSFWVLTDNSPPNSFLIRQKPVSLLAESAHVTSEVALYCLVLALKGTVVLNGVRRFMAKDLEGVARVRAWAEANRNDWEDIVKHFKDLTGDNDNS